MQVTDFSFELPSELIAQEPAPERTASRLMVVSRHADEPARHTTFAHLPEFLRGGDVLVVSVNAVLAKAPSDACTEAIVGDLAKRFAAR